MNTPQASTWSLAPAPGPSEPPALISDAENLWLAYARADGRGMAIVHFGGVIEHRLVPIGGEGLARHPYASAGLQRYAFHELTDTPETARGSATSARHWVVVCKDHALDVVARSGEVIVPAMEAGTPLQGLLAELAYGAA